MCTVFYYRSKKQGDRHRSRLWSGWLLVLVTTDLDYRTPLLAPPANHKLLSMRTVAYGVYCTCK
jgi:hypothetical protein